MRFRGVKVIVRDGLEVTDQLRRDMFLAWQDLQLLHATQPGLQYKYMISGNKSWKVSSLNGVDRIELLGYPPEKKEEKREPKIRQRKRVYVWPAFEAFSSEKEHIGYVVARGGGWKSPYEFIPKTSADRSDIFEWGQWLENYESPPFDSLDTYLKAKPICRIKDVDYQDIPPIGTKNRMFKCLAEYEETQVDGYDPAGWEPLSGQNPFGQYFCYALTPFWKSYNEKRLFDITYGKAGETGEEPPMHPIKWWYYTTWDANTEAVNALTTSIKQATGVMSALRILGGTYEGTIEGCPVRVATSDYHTYVIEEYTWPYMFQGDLQNKMMPAYEYGDGSENPLITRNTTTYQYTLSASEDYVSDNLDFSSKRSSTEDLNHFALLYYRFLGQAARSVSWQYDHSLLPFCDLPGDIPLIWEDDASLFVNLSGQEFIVGDYTYSDLEYVNSDRNANNAIRYYRVGNTEYLLCMADVTSYMEPDNLIHHYVFVSKSDDKVVFDDSVVLTEGSDGYTTLPEVLDLDGNSVLITNRFRLIRETVTIIEEYI
jgi:hypothetical protein